VRPIDNPLYYPPTKQQLTSGTRYRRAPQKFVVGGWVENDEEVKDVFIKKE